MRTFEYPRPVGVPCNGGLPPFGIEGRKAIFTDMFFGGDRLARQEKNAWKIDHDGDSDKPPGNLNLRAV